MKHCKPKPNWRTTVPCYSQEFCGIHDPDPRLPNYLQFWTFLFNVTKHTNIRRREFWKAVYQQDPDCINIMFGVYFQLKDKIEYQQLKAFENTVNFYRENMFK
jgi:hypothetical protein